MDTSPTQYQTFESTAGASGSTTVTEVIDGPASDSTAEVRISSKTRWVKGVKGVHFNSLQFSDMSVFCVCPKVIPIKFLLLLISVVCLFTVCSFESNRVVKK